MTAIELYPDNLEYRIRVGFVALRRLADARSHFGDDNVRSVVKRRISYVPYMH